MRRTCRVLLVCAAMCLSVPLLAQEVPKRILELPPADVEIAPSKKTTVSDFLPEPPVLIRRKPFYPPPRDYWLAEAPKSLPPQKVSEESIVAVVKYIKARVMEASPYGYIGSNPASQVPTLVPTMRIPFGAIADAATSIANVFRASEEQPTEQSRAPKFPPPRTLPKTAEDHYAWAQFYISEIRIKGAMHDLDKAIELKPTFAEAYLLRGELYMLSERHDLAVADFNAAIQLKPNDVAYVHRGVSNKQLQRRAAAEADFLKALELNPKNALAKSELQLLRSNAKTQTN